MFGNLIVAALNCVPTAIPRKPENFNLKRYWRNLDIIKYGYCGKPGPRPEITGWPLRLGGVFLINNFSTGDRYDRRIFIIVARFAYRIKKEIVMLIKLIYMEICEYRNV